MGRSVGSMSDPVHCCVSRVGNGEFWSPVIGKILEDEQVVRSRKDY